MKTKTYYAWAVLRRGKTFSTERVFPRWLKLHEIIGKNEIEFLTLFYDRKSAEKWKNHWQNKEDFSVLRVEIPFRVEV
jgi:hypothetical protein